MTTAARLLGLLLVATSHAAAQTPLGAIAGSVSDPTGSPVSGVAVRITHVATGQVRDSMTSGDGHYAADALAPALYEVTVEARGFKRLRHDASVDAGTTTSVDLVLEIGDLDETVLVAGEPPLLHRDAYGVGGVVTRAQIDALPSNGRNFLELARLEPGVTSPVRLSDNRVFVAPLGSGLQTIPRVGATRVTVDGASLTTPGTVGTLLQVSQDAVQEFQIATVNFGASTSATTNGAINIVTRSGTNQLRGSALAFYRDHDVAAYPGLQRDPANPQPFFRQVQFGAHGGGALVRDRLFVFAAWEGIDQQGVRSVQPRAPEFAHLGGIFPSPYTGNQVHVRADAPLSGRHSAFARYTSDRNRAFAPAGPANLPSGWSRRKIDAGQAVTGLTSVLSARLVNDFRASLLRVDVPTTPADGDDCPGLFRTGRTEHRDSGCRHRLWIAGDPDLPRATGGR